MHPLTLSEGHLQPGGEAAAGLQCRFQKNHTGGWLEVVGSGWRWLLGGEAAVQDSPPELDILCSSHRTGFGQSHTIWAVRKVTGRRRVDRS